MAIRKMSSRIAAATHTAFSNGRRRRRGRRKENPEKRKLNKSNFPVSKLSFPIPPPSSTSSTKKKALMRMAKRQKQSFLIKSDLWGRFHRQTAVSQAHLNFTSSQTQFSLNHLLISNVSSVFLIRRIISFNFPRNLHQSSIGSRETRKICWQKINSAEKFFHFSASLFLRPIPLDGYVADLIQIFFFLRYFHIHLGNCFSSHHRLLSRFALIFHDFPMKISRNGLERAQQTAFV